MVSNRCAQLRDEPRSSSLCDEPRFRVPRPRLGVGVSSNVKLIRTPTQGRGRGTRFGECVLFSLKERLTALSGTQRLFSNEEVPLLRRFGSAVLFSIARQSRDRRNSAEPKRFSSGTSGSNDRIS